TACRLECRCVALAFSIRSAALVYRSAEPSSGLGAEYCPDGSSGRAGRHHFATFVPAPRLQMAAFRDHVCPAVTPRAEVDPFQTTLRGMVDLLAQGVRYRDFDALAPHGRDQIASPMQSRSPYPTVTARRGLRRVVLDTRRPVSGDPAESV